MLRGTLQAFPTMRIEKVYKGTEYGNAIEKVLVLHNDGVSDDDPKMPSVFATRTVNGASDIKIRSVRRITRKTLSELELAG